MRAHRIHQERFANVFSEMDLRLRSWLIVNSLLRYDVETSFQRNIHQVTVQPNNVWSASLSYRYSSTTIQRSLIRWLPSSGIRQSRFLRKNWKSPVTKRSKRRFHYRLNENWAVRIAEDSKDATALSKSNSIQFTAICGVGQRH